MNADVTCEPHFHVEVYRIHNNFLDIDIKVAQHSFEENGLNLRFRSVVFEKQKVSLSVVIKNADSGNHCLVVL
jgi:hypothetical protein